MQRYKIRVEKVYANSYHQNLLLNLPKLLFRSKHITNVSLRRLKPQTESYILQWEDYNGVFLPNDVKDFYLANDGFQFLWTYNPIPEGLPIQCGIHVNCLNDLDALTGYEVTSKAGISMKNGRKVLALSVNSKVFEVEPIGDSACVCLVYYNVWLRPTIWLWCKNTGFFFLSKDFTTYFRMCITHLGITGWQYTFSTIQLSKWSHRIMRKLAPHLLKRPYDYVIQQRQSNDSNTCQVSSNLNQTCQSRCGDVRYVGEGGGALENKNQGKLEEGEGGIVINKLDLNVFVNTTLVNPNWGSMYEGGSTKGGVGRTKSSGALLHAINANKSRSVSVVSKVRTKNILKNEKLMKDRPRSSKSTPRNNKRNLAPAIFSKKSKNAKK